MAEKDYSDSFLDENFWDKVTRMPETAGCSGPRAAYTLYALLRESSTPLWAKPLSSAPWVTWSAL